MITENFLTQLQDATNERLAERVDHLIAQVQGIIKGRNTFCFNVQNDLLSPSTPASVFATEILGGDITQVQVNAADFLTEVHAIAETLGVMKSHYDAQVVIPDPWRNIPATEQDDEYSTGGQLLLRLFDDHTRDLFARDDVLLQFARLFPDAIANKDADPLTNRYTQEEVAIETPDDLAMQRLMLAAYAIPTGSCGEPCTDKQRLLWSYVGYHDPSTIESYEEREIDVATLLKRRTLRNLYKVLNTTDASWQLLESAGETPAEGIAKMREYLTTQVLGGLVQELTITLDFLITRRALEMREWLNAAAQIATAPAITETAERLVRETKRKMRHTAADDPNDADALADTTQKYATAFRTAALLEKAAKIDFTAHHALAGRIIARHSLRFGNATTRLLTADA